MCISCSTNKKVVTYNKTISIYPISKNGLWGYADENGELQIDYQFEEVSFFSEGLAAAKTNGKYGLINQLGEFESKVKYDSIKHVRRNQALVFKNGKSQWVNKKGKKLKSPKRKAYGYCGTGTPAPASDPMDYFVKVGNKYQLNDKDIAN